jgi:hypothetical protein
VDPPFTSSDGILEGELRRIDERHKSALHRVDERHVASWEAHKDVHHQEQEAIKVALANQEKRLDALNELRGVVDDREKTFATKEAFGSLEQRFTRFEEDTRRRFEEMGVELRRESRPGQDLKLGTSTIISVIVIGISILGFIIVVANYLSSRP